MCNVSSVAAGASRVFQRIPANVETEQSVLIKQTEALVQQSVCGNYGTETTMALKPLCDIKTGAKVLSLSM
eukprot:1156620-Pelagomonas_calceolata.AAC.15